MRSTDLTSEIIAYLDAHPHAVDSIGGIASHWLSSRKYDEAEIERTLEKLAAQGVVERIVLTSGSVVYGRLATART